MIACMGGFRCPKRELCGHYRPGLRSTIPIEKLCTSGFDRFKEREFRKPAPAPVPDPEPALELAVPQGPKQPAFWRAR